VKEEYYYNSVFIVPEVTYTRGCHCMVSRKDLILATLTEQRTNDKFLPRLRLSYCPTCI